MKSIDDNTLDKLIKDKEIYENLYIPLERVCLRLSQLIYFNKILLSRGDNHYNPIFKSFDTLYDEFIKLMECKISKSSLRNVIQRGNVEDTRIDKLEMILECGELILNSSMIKSNEFDRYLIKNSTKIKEYNRIINKVDESIKTHLRLSVSKPS